MSWVDANSEQLIEELRECCRIPSISAEGGPAMDEMARWLGDQLAPVLDETRVVPVANAAPAVLGRAQGALPYTILLYSHYDVQPVEPLGDWSAPPFAAELRNGRIIARGVADDKADIMARLHAIRAFRATGRPLPCSLVWLSEGAEEVGSPGLRHLLEEYAELLRADACIWESYLRRDDGQPEIGFGCRGIVYVELTCRLLSRDQHSAFAGVFRSAAVELAHALATLVDVDGRPTVDGFGADATRPDEGDEAAVAAVEVPSAAEAALPGRRVLVGRPNAEISRRMVLEPTINISGFSAGYTDPGAKTVLPAHATAKLDIRLVDGQTPDAVVDQLRRHLDRHGFTDVSIEVLHSEPASKGPRDSTLARALVQAARDCFGEPVVYPMVPGAGPLHIVNEALGIHAVMPPGSTRMASGIHGPDESISVSDYLDHVKFTVRMFERAAEIEAAFQPDHGETYNLTITA
ncbi:M20/M25/M40 family metallo-hydrolase [Micromonospora rhizosphaerae]|nr:M20/M25/M40 family metallo-hydrolase [Micromonospora rhizosphaerae]